MRTVLVAISLVVSATWAHAIDDSDRSAARATIKRQIEAFRRNDSAAAYEQAAPQIRNLFSSPETFIAMVEKGYAPVLRPRSYGFSTSDAAGDDEIAQGVTLQDENGVDWVALYTLQKQVDGEWRITGCQLKRAPGLDAYINKYIPA